MAYSFTQYTGDGATQTFPVPFPYITKEHVKVTVNGITALFTWVTSGSIKINQTPANGALVVIRRESSPDQNIVDFHDGAILKETDLDKAVLQNFYLAQELKDLYDAYINASLVQFAQNNNVQTIPGEDLADQIVTEVLQSALYTDLATRITDIDQNAETLLQMSQTDESHSLSITSLNAQYTVKIDANGYVSGYGLAVYPSDEGTYKSTFTILADQFAVVTPGVNASVPFSVGTTGYGANTVGINGQLILNGTLYADAIVAESITADKLEVTSLEALVGTFDSIQTNSIYIGTSPGTRMEVDSADSYIMWYGTGTKNDQNALFYLKTDGTARFAGALEGATGTFSGELQAATGTFQGTMNAGSIQLVGAGVFDVKTAATGARLEMTGSVIKVYDSSGVLRVQLGDLSV